MARSRLRSTPQSRDTASEEVSLAPWPQSTSLHELKEAMSSPGVIQAEVDALFAAIARPPADGETPRARADFLLSLMDLPEEARERKGSDGRTVRAAALEALMELGYPYALEVHPDVLEAVRGDAFGGKDAARSIPISKPAIAVTLLALISQVIMLVLIAMSRGRSYVGETFHLITLGLIVGPPLLAASGHALGMRGMQSMGARGMMLQGLVWLFIAWLDSGTYQGYLPLVLIPWYLPLIAAVLMREKSEDADTPPAAPVKPA